MVDCVEQVLQERLGHEIGGDRQREGALHGVDVLAGDADGAPYRHGQEQDDEQQPWRARLDIEADQLVVRPLEKCRAVEGGTAAGQQLADCPKTQAPGMVARER